ncbi:zinc-binding alcohol dehydrogenase family protein [Streptomyces sp. NBC_01190]|uniref:quinone oxidoreductase family protein n=1 Tax=Streptomyces sp. NBC_01190 TaxID=2903767 RepID=UPI003863047F|nr:zinc-binding dehydrogenase [Streptomyces sp. NBC_01190]
MRIVRYHRYGPPGVLQVHEADLPEPGRGMVRLRAEAIGVNFAGLQERQGVFYAHRAEPPASPGGDVTGFVDALGPDVTGVELGARVASIIFKDSYADYVLARARDLVAVPDGMDAAQATMLSSPGQVGLEVVKAARIQPGDTVLVHAAAGAIGHLVVQIAKEFGAGTVVAAANSPAKLKFAMELGADAAVDYSRGDWADRVRELTGGRGIDVVLDSVGADVTTRSIALLRPYGRLVFYGSASGGRQLPTVSMEEIAGVRYVTHFTMAALDGNLAAIEESARTFSELVRSGRVRPVVHTRLPLTDAVAAHQLMEERKQLGRVVLVP